MKKSITVMVGLFVISFLIIDSSNTVEAQNVVDQEQDKMIQYIAQVEEMIKGKEDQPAKDVFKNIKIEAMKNFPASRLVGIMRIAFANSLGTDCMHCHVENDWASDEKRQKDIARGMWELMGETSAKVREITGNDDAVSVNCTFCHGGSIIPGTPNPKN